MKKITKKYQNDREDVYAHTVLEILNKPSYEEARAILGVFYKKMRVLDHKMRKHIQKKL